MSVRCCLRQYTPSSGVMLLEGKIYYILPVHKKSLHVCLTINNSRPFVFSRSDLVKHGITMCYCVPSVKQLLFNCSSSVVYRTEDTDPQYKYKYLPRDTPTKWCVLLASSRNSNSQRDHSCLPLILISCKSIYI